MCMYIYMYVCMCVLCNAPKASHWNPCQCCAFDLSAGFELHRESSMTSQTFGFGHRKVVERFREHMVRTSYNGSAVVESPFEFLAPISRRRRSIDLDLDLGLQNLKPVSGFWGFGVSKGCGKGSGLRFFFFVLTRANARNPLHSIRIDSIASQQSSPDWALSGPNPASIMEACPPCQSNLCLGFRVWIAEFGLGFRAWIAKL
jgi:hypothetical protein